MWNTRPIIAVMLFIAAFAVAIAYGVRISAAEQQDSKSSAASPAEKPDAKKNSSDGKNKIEKVTKTEAQWRKILSPLAFDVLRKKGTERAFTGEYYDYHGTGIYRCAGCGLELFDSKTKFDSGTGWPSFYAPIAPQNVVEHTDRDLGMVRTEVVCARCGGHLGHVFEDGPKPTGLRYCMNSVSLRFDNESKKPAAAAASPKK